MSPIHGWSFSMRVPRFCLGVLCLLALGLSGCPSAPPAGNDATAVTPPAENAPPPAGDNQAQVAPPAAKPPAPGDDLGFAIPAGWPADVPLPQGTVTYSDDLGETGRSVNITVAGQTFEQLIAQYAMLQQQGWERVNGIENGIKNNTLAQFTYNKGPQRLSVNITRGMVGPDAVEVRAAIGQNRDFKPE